MKVIKPSNLPTKFPVTFTAVVYLMIDKFQPAGWVVGVIWTLVVLLWIMAIIIIYKQKHTDIFADTDPTSKWAQKLKDLQNKTNS